VVNGKNFISSLLIKNIDVASVIILLEFLSISKLCKKPVQGLQQMKFVLKLQEES